MEVSVTPVAVAPDALPGPQTWPRLPNEPAPPPAESLEEEEEEEEDDDDEEEGASRGLVESLMTQLGQHREVLAPVATSAAAAAAAYAARKLPQLIEELEQGGTDKVRERLGQASSAGGVKGFAAGAASRAFSSGGGGGLLERLRQGGEEEADSEAREAGGMKGMLAKAGGGSQEGGSGWGKGRRLPIMRSIDVAAPLDTVYNQWTQFEEMGSFLHRVESVEQQEDEKVVWHENIWGRRRDWNAKILEQVPNERIKWKLTGGGQGTGVITFHELAPRLTRVEAVFDWQPSGMVEKMASGLRFHNRAAKADLKRFKAFVETRGEESGRWRGRIEDGSVKGNPRNQRNRDAEAIPEGQRQHSEGEQEESGGRNGSGSDGEARARARDARRTNREQRQKART